MEKNNTPTKPFIFTNKTIAAACAYITYVYIWARALLTYNSLSPQPHFIFAQRVKLRHKQEQLKGVLWGNKRNKNPNYTLSTCGVPSIERNEIATLATTKGERERRIRKIWYCHLWFYIRCVLLLLPNRLTTERKKKKKKTKQEITF